MRRLLAVWLVALAASACEHPVSRAEFDQLQTSYDLLRTQLQAWSGGMVSWGQDTGDAVCELMDKNGPQSKYSVDIQTYCGDSDPPSNHPPDDPDDWGED